METVLKAAAERADDAVAVLRSWVEQNSFSRDVDRVNAMGTMLRAAFALPGLSCAQQAGGEGYGDHLCWHTPAWEARPADRVVLIGHHDTVFPPGTFEGWRRDGDIARGPGVLDMKGGIAIIHTALFTLSQTGQLGDIPLAFVCVADEEIGSRDSAPFTASWARGAACALVFEAGRAEDAIITRRKGVGGFAVEVRGKAAHAGNHHGDGVNAIWALAQLVDAAQRITDYDRGMTVNVGTAVGGTSANTVPASAQAAIDFRFERAADGDDIARAIQRAAKEVERKTGANIALTGGVRRPPLERTPASAALYRRYASAARACGLGGGEAGQLGGGSDANNVAGLGVPAIDGLGPRGSGFHTHDELIEVSSLAMRTEALLRFLLADAG